MEIMQDRTMRLRTDSAQTTARDDVRPLAPRWVFQGCLLIYVVALAWVTLRPRPSSFQPPAEWIPFNNIINVLREGRSVSYEDAGQLLGNIALFVPFGWLVPMLWPRLRSFWMIVILAAATSLAIEVAQWLFLFGRQSSVDDVILNTVGALVGAVMFFAPRNES
jgi:glycopeptide antibiotics resistance protein